MTMAQSTPNKKTKKTTHNKNNAVENNIKIIKVGQKQKRKDKYFCKAQTSDIKTELDAVQTSVTSYTHVETPQAESGNNNDYN